MPSDREPHRLVQITTVPQSLGFLKGQAASMRDRGLSSSAISSPGEALDEHGRREGVPTFAMPMTRRITPARDLVAIWRLFRLLRRIRPEIIHTHTPKGGLLGSIAGWLARVPIRIHHLHGLPFLTANGLKRSLLRGSDWVSCLLAHQVLCVSRSNAEIAVAEGLCRARKIKVLLSGSINGIDAEGEFHPGCVGTESRRDARRSLGIDEGARVIGFVGRVVRDKGIVELAEAWCLLRDDFPDLRLIVIGEPEPGDPVPPDTIRRLGEDCRVHLVSASSDMPRHYASMDLLVLPTHREGLGLVALEAAAMGLPVVATLVSGCVDAVVDGETGSLVPPYDPVALAAAIRTYLDDPSLRAVHGMAGRERVLRDFRPEAAWDALFDEYSRLCVERGISRPRPPLEGGPQGSAAAASLNEEEPSHASCSHC